MSAARANAIASVREIASSVRPEDEADILARTEAKLHADVHVHAFRTLLVNVRMLIRMLGDRTFALAWSTKALILAALVYFVLPTDLTPDVIPIVGYVDDTLVIGWVVKRLAHEIERYAHHRLSS
jgi:uncharacterized membrane protein YkvA (DUF1232 family)